MKFLRRTLLVAGLVPMFYGCAGSQVQNAPQPAQPAPIPEQSIGLPAPIKDTRQRAKVHTDLGFMYLKDRNFEVALQEAQIAKDLDSDYAPNYNLLGLIHMALGQNSDADSNFRRALSLSANSPEINNNYGWFLCQTGRVKESFSYFQQALRNPLNKSPASAMHNLGVCYLVDKDDVNAESYLFRAHKMDANNLQAYYLLADIGYRNRRYDDAREWMKQLHAKTEPNAESAWLALRIDRKIGDREGEARFTGIMRRNYRDSPEYQKMIRGEFD